MTPMTAPIDRLPGWIVELAVCTGLKAGASVTFTEDSLTLWLDLVETAPAGQVVNLPTRHEPEPVEVTFYEANADGSYGDAEPEPDDVPEPAAPEPVKDPPADPPPAAAATTKRRRRPAPVDDEPLMPLTAGQRMAARRERMARKRVTA